jgi:Zn ribbon nucleic-acid-binding protein
MVRMIHARWCPQCQRAFSVSKWSLHISRSPNHRAQHQAAGLEPRPLPAGAAAPGVETNDPSWEESWEEREVTPVEHVEPANQDRMVDEGFDGGMGDGESMEDIEAGGEDVVFANAGSILT